MRFDDFVLALQAAGWRGTFDEHRSGIQQLWARMFPGLVATAAPMSITTKPAAQLHRQWLFIDRLLSSDPLAWRTALEQEDEALRGRVLDDDSFHALLCCLIAKPGHATAEWVESIAPHLTTAQMRDLVIVGASHHHNGSNT